MNRHRKGQPDEHTARVRLDRPVDEFTDLRKFLDRWDAVACLRIGESKNRSIEIDVFTPRELRIEAGSKLEKSGNTACDCDAAGRWPDNTCNDAQQRALARTVLTDDAKATSTIDRKIDILYCPKWLVIAALPEAQQFLQVVGRMAINP